MTGFTFFQNYFDAISDEESGLSEEEQGRLYNAIFSYMFRDEEPNLKGACRMAFNLIKPSLDRSKQNGRNRSKNGSEMETEISEMETESKEMEIKSNGMETETSEMEIEKSPFFEKKEEEKEISTVGLITRTPARETDETVESYLLFQREHPKINVDITNPSLIDTVDFALLSRKISESKFLQTRLSLAWLISNYAKIIGDSYKDYDANVSTDEVLDEKGDLALWAELKAALEKAREPTWCSSESRYIELYRMADESAKGGMSAIYRALSPEITDYFEPNSFLDLCGMSDEDMKFERARFLKSLPGIRKKLRRKKHGVG